MTKDMTNGSPMKLILGFSIPLLFGYLFQQFYNLVDTLIVGRFLGVDALAAVGSTGSLNFLIIGFCMGVCNGFAIPLAHKFGAGDYRGLRAFMVNAIYLSAIFAVVMTAVTVVFCRPILELMRTPDNIIDGAYLYIVIIFAARYVAKNIVAAGLAEKCEIQLSYAIGVAQPTSVMVDTFGTGKLSDEKLVEIIRENFDLRPAGIIKMLDLRRPIYRGTAAYGHFGRTDLDLPWEAVDKAETLKKYL